MSEPLVCAVMLVNGREAMVRRAVESFRVQTYSNSVLVIWDNGNRRVCVDQQPFDRNWWWIGERKSIGAMRNDVIQWSLEGRTPHPDVFCHWDSDDWSHPNRIAEQVALLQSSGAECVGYHDLLFWDERKSEAWLYTNSAPDRYSCPPGTSLMYWRRAWERNRFRDTSAGEDLYFTGRLKVRTVSSIGDEPRMIAGIHGGNSCSKIAPGNDVWKRAAQWDVHCRERMAYDSKPALQA